MYDIFAEMPTFRNQMQVKCELSFAEWGYQGLIHLLCPQKITTFQDSPTPILYGRHNCMVTSQTLGPPKKVQGQRPKKFTLFGP